MKKNKQIRIGFVAIVFFLSCNTLITGISAIIIQTEGASDNGIESYCNNPLTGWVEAHNDIPTGKKYMLYEKSGGYWADAEKSPTNTEDDLLCWAGTACNMLEYTGWGFVGGMEYGNTDNFFQYFQDHVTDKAGRIEYGIDWWFDGTLKSPSSSWSSELIDIYRILFGPSFEKRYNIHNHEGFWNEFKPSDYISNFESDKNTLPNIKKSFEQGCAVGLSIDQIKGDGRHGITCWGFNYNPYVDPIKNPEDYYLGIWVTDSDDDKSTINPDDVLKYFRVEYNDDKDYWYMPSRGKYGWKIDGVTSLKVFPGYCRPESKISIKQKSGNFLWFDASSSKNWAPGNLRYRWDFNGDGIWDTNWRDHPGIWHVYGKNEPYLTKVYLEVFDGRLRDIDTRYIVTQSIPPQPPPV